MGNSQCPVLISTEIIKKMMFLLSYSYGCNVSSTLFGILPSVLPSKTPNGSFSPSNSIFSPRVDFIPCQGTLLFAPPCTFFLGSLLFRPQVSFFSSQKAISFLCRQAPCLVCLSLSWVVALTRWAVLVCMCVHACRCSHVCFLCACMCVHVHTLCS